MDDLRTRIQEYIRDGLLPSDQCLIAWYGPGRGQICEVCTGRILGSEVAVECELRGGAVIWFHASCYGLWYSMLGGCARG
jgi:hypothetical protein